MSGAVQDAVALALALGFAVLDGVIPVVPQVDVVGAVRRHPLTVRPLRGISAAGR